ncbi:MAG: DUF6051 family protein, partial [Spirochaetaceae bacterium]
MTSPTTLDTYQALDRTLERLFSLDVERTDLEPTTGDPLEIRTEEWRSRNWQAHPPEATTNTDAELRNLVAERIERFPYVDRSFFGTLLPADRDVPENLRFRYPVFTPKRPGTTEGSADGAAYGAGSPTAATEQPDRFDRAVILLHGLNEKSWGKYLPWAYRLAQHTACPVIMFPIAFHMNRAPAVWSDPRAMSRISRERGRRFPAVEATSFVNAALSHRVHFAPHRFLTSGLQTYYDITDLIRRIRCGEHPLFAEGARADIFAYSIGATLAELLLFSDPAGLFASSRGFLFCGGAVLDRCAPVSKAIIDSEAHRALRTFFDRLVTGSSRIDPALGADGLRAWELEIARSLLFHDRFRGFREKTARAVGDRITMLAMAGDRVFPPEWLADSWTAADGSQLFEVERAAPDYDYAHERPFPRGEAARPAAEEFFE